MKNHACQAALLALTAAVFSCGPKPKAAATAAAPPDDPATLLRVGSVAVQQADLDYQLKENHGGRHDAQTRQQALDELAERARLVQAALDAGLDRDPLVRAEISRLLAARLKEQSLTPRLREVAATPVPESRLRELYTAGEARFRVPEKRQVAVLWLNPNGEPQRATQYADKLATARDWLSNNADLKAHPDQGFSVLSVDHSEHAASRYQGGMIGWLERAGGMDAWSKAVAEIAFSLTEPGAVSPVVTRPEGVFLVRYMAQQPAVLRPFETVKSELEQAERARLRQAAEAAFQLAIAEKYPVQKPAPPAPAKTSPTL